jgi:hyperosmotically inducible protein
MKRALGPTSTLFVTLAVAGMVAAKAAEPSDASLTTRAKVALYTSPVTSKSDINVDTISGTVTLHGKVASEAARAQAEKTVKRIAGVQKVRNLLRVEPEVKEPTAINDTEIKDQAESALKGERSLADSKIAVQSVHKGVVRISGTAANQADYLQAVERVREIDGVRGVESGVRTKEPSGRASKESKESLAKEISSGARDLWITSDVKLRLLASPDVPSSDVNVDVRHGVVTLFGMVPSNEARTEAVEQAKRVDGVAQVKDEIAIVPESKRELVEMRDEDLERSVKNDLKKHSELDGVKVEVKNGVARLTGKVDSQTLQLKAATVARAVKGVRAVDQDLHIERD